MRSARAALAFIAASFLAGCGAHSGSGTLLPGGDRARQGTVAGPADTLYVSGDEQVSAFALDASGSAAPSRTITPHAFQTDGITGIATAADATLDILQDYRDNASAPDCRVVQEASDASGMGPKSNQLECNSTSGGPGTRGRAIARGPNFEIDVLDTLSGADYIQRTSFSSASPFDTGFIGPLPGAGGTHHGLAEGTGGHIYVSSSSAGAPIPYAGSATPMVCSSGAAGAATIDNYAPNAASNASPVHTFTIAGRTAAGAIALAPDNATLYAVTCDAAGQLWIDTVQTTGATGSVAPTRSIGPFVTTFVTALAVDAQSELYAGLTASDATGVNHVRVYAANAAGGKPAPLRVLLNPVPPSSNQRITGLAISQAPYTSPQASPTVVYNSIPSGPLTSKFSSLGFQSNHELEFGDGVNLAQTGALHSVSWILRSFGCQSRPSGPCVTTPGATFPISATANVYAVTATGTHVGALLASRAQIFNIPFRPSSDPTHCASSPDLFFDMVSQTCVDGLAVRIDFIVPGAVALPSTAIFTLTFNTTTFGYSPLGTGTACFSSSGGCGYDQLNISASTLGGPVGSAYDPNSVFQALGTPTATYEGGDCSPTPLYATSDLQIDNGCWGATADFPNGLHPQLQVTTQ